MISLEVLTSSSFFSEEEDDSLDSSTGVMIADKATTIKAKTTVPTPIQ